MNRLATIDVATADVATVATPCGPFTVMADGDVVVASGWTADPGQLGAGGVRWHLRRDLGPITRAVTAYFSGDTDAIGAVARRQRSGPFVAAVWEALRAVPAGSTVSYAALAARCGRPAAARAAGSACGRNAVALFVPCHRAQCGDGSLGGFRWGLPVKRWLLDHEAAMSPVVVSDGKFAGRGVVGVELAVDEERHRYQPR